MGHNSEKETKQTNKQNSIVTVERFPFSNSFSKMFMLTAFVLWGVQIPLGYMSNRFEIFYIFNLSKDQMK